MVEGVADDGLEGDGDAEVVELFGEEEGVGVLPVRGEHFGADGDDFSDHIRLDSETPIAAGVCGMRRCRGTLPLPVLCGKMFDPNALGSD